MDLYLRGSGAVQSLIARPTGSYLIITHGAIMQMVLFAILGLTPQEHFYQVRFHFGNTSVNELHYDSANNHWSILSINNLSHLTDNL